MKKTERQICEALLALMEEKPFAKVKVTELTEKAHISRSTFYSYYDSLYDVLQAIEDDFLSHIAEEREVRAKFDMAVVEKNFSYIRDNLQMLETLIGPNGDASFLARLGNRSKRILLTIADSSGSSLTDTQLAIINEFSRAGKLQVFRWWAQHKNDVSVNEIIDMLERVSTSIHRIVIGQ